MLVAGLVTTGYFYARHVERRALPALTGTDALGLYRLRGLQVEALRKPDLLPVFGSSELVRPDPYHPRHLFQGEPTGFAPLTLGELAGCSLLHLQKMAALGTHLRGKKVVLSFTPSTFQQITIPVHYYAGNFSHLDAGELAFSTDLSFALKQQAARRLLDYPGPLREDPLLRFALEKLADGSPYSRGLYYVLFPLGKVQNAFFRLQDHWDAVHLLPDLTSSEPHRGPAPEHGIKWPALLQQAERDYQEERYAGVPPGLDKMVWSRRVRKGIPNLPEGATDEAFVRVLQQTHEWDDLDLLLRTLRELGAEPLLLSTPLRGSYLEATGVSCRARQVYYERLRAVARTRQVPVIDFADHDQDRYFLFDLSHLSSKGWIYYAQAFDAYYHGRRLAALDADRLSVRSGGSVMSRP